MLCLCGLPGGEAMNRSDLLQGSGRGSERQRGWINIINDNGVCSYEKILCYSWGISFIRAVWLRKGRTG